MKKQPNKTKSDAKPKAEPRENTRENRETEKQSTDKLAIIWRSARRPYRSSRSAYCFMSCWSIFRR